MNGSDPRLKGTGSLPSDIVDYFASRPAIPTLIEFENEHTRDDYTHRIAQRVGIDVSQYSVLNLHRIGITAPVRFVFEEILSWVGDSPYWPDHVATLDTVDGEPDHVRVTLLGKSLGRWLSRVTDGRIGTLFEMHLKTLRAVPGDSDVDNARYLLWHCRGGYPIGIFSVFARSPMSSLNEAESTQLFFAVGFNPYGRRALAEIRPIRRAWERIHNRVTGNVLNRFKALCEARFAETQQGMESEPEPD